MTQNKRKSDVCPMVQWVKEGQCYTQNLSLASVS